MEFGFYVSAYTVVFFEMSPCLMVANVSNSKHVIVLAISVQ